MKKKFTLITSFTICILAAIQTVVAQTNTFPATGAAGIGTLTPDASSLLDITSTTKGILIPRMTQAQRNAIVGPVTGLMIYQTTNTPGFYYYSGTSWTAISSKGANATLSNLKAPTAVNQSLLPAVTNSIDLGSSALMWRNAYLSGDALINGITVGRGNGNLPYNVAVGCQALQTNTIGNSNTANGYRALYANTAGSGNTANGETTLYFNTTGSGNTASGYEALYFNADGSGNTANGYNALFSNTSGYSNVAVGAGALYYNTTRPNLVAVGDSALLNNTTGFCNTAIGSKSLSSNTTGDNNTGIGFNALFSNNAYGNTANGSFALYSNTTGPANTANGEAALYSNVTGSSNTALGSYTDVSLNNLANATAIGYNAIVSASNKVRIGNSFITVVESNAGFWTVSDGRFKNDIKEDVKGLEFIKLLRPVTYSFDTKRFDEFLMQKYPDSRKQKRFEQMDKTATAKASAIIQSDFIAQEVAEAVKKSGYNFNGVHAPENPTDNWSLSYEKLVVPLVKAIQELSKSNDDKDARIDAQQKQIDELKRMVLSLQQSFNQCNPCVQKSQISSELSVRSAAALQQNVPNPFNHTTTINYTLPQRYSSAKIIVTDKAGKVLKQENLTLKGKGSLNVDASAFASGAYQYSLYVNGKLIDKKANGAP